MPDGAKRSIPTWVLGVVAGVFWLIVAGSFVHYGQHYYLDFRVYRTAGRALFEGKPVYSMHFTTYHLSFTYPPFALLVLSPLALGKFGVIKTLWWIANAAVLCSIMTIALRSATKLRGGRSIAIGSAMAALSAAILEPVRSNMDYGQINWILILLVLADLARPNSRWRGVPIGIAAAIKMTPLVFILFFLIRKDWRSAIRASGTFVVATGLAWIIEPSFSAKYWFHLIFDTGRIGGIGFVSNQSWNGMLYRAPFNAFLHEKEAWALLCIGTVAVTVFLVSALLKEEKRLQAILALAMCELLVSPITWSHHWSWLAIAPVVLPDLWRRRRTAAILISIVLATAIASPYWWDWLGFTGFLAHNALILTGAPTLVVWLIVERRGRWRPPTSVPDDEAALAALESATASV